MTKRTTLSPLGKALETSPAKQPDGPQNEDPDNNLVLVAVALKTHCKYIVLGRILAKRNALLETKRLCTLSA